MIEDLLTALSQRIGMTIPPDRWNFVVADLARAVARMQDEETLHADSAAAVEPLLRLAREANLDHPVVGALVRCITIPESYFFRDTSQWEVLRATVLPEILGERRDLRGLSVFSAGCSSGEELYSMAILLQRMGVPALGWDCRLLGGDVSATSISLARSGRYSSWSLRGVEEEVVRRYFTEEGAHYELLPEIRQMATFRTLNLNVPLGIGAQDLVFFRNVGIYFAPEVRRRILSNLIDSLREGGYLVVGAAELALESLPQLEPVGESIYRKGGSAAQEIAPARSDSGTGKGVRNASPRPVARPNSRVAPRPTTVRRAASSTQATSSPSAPGQLLVQGRLLADRGELAQAEDHFLRHLQDYPEDVEARYLLGVTQQSTGRAEEALDSFRAAVYFDRTFVAGHFSLALLYLQKGATRQAKRHFTQIRQLLTPPQEGRTHLTGQTDRQILSITEEHLNRV